MIRPPNIISQLECYLWTHSRMNHIRFKHFIKSLNPRPCVMVNDKRFSISIGRFVDPDFNDYHDDMMDHIGEFNKDGYCINAYHDKTMIGVSRGIVILICVEEGIRFEVDMENTVRNDYDYEEIATHFALEVSRILEEYQYY